MNHDTEEEIRELITPMGAIEITSIIGVFRENYSGNNQIVHKRLEKLNFKADGDWFTTDMAYELSGWMLNGLSQPPDWLCD